MHPISPVTNYAPQDLEKDKLYKVKGERFMIYCNLPISDLKISRYKSAVFTISGDAGQICDVQIVSSSKLRHSNFAVSQILNKDEAILKDLKATDLMMGYQVPAGATVKIKWN